MTCPSCGQSVELRQDGNIKVHRYLSYGHGGHLKRCPHSGRSPLAPYKDPS